MAKINREILITKKDIAKRVKELAAEISKDYKDKKPLLIGILKGSFIFLADLIRDIDPKIEPHVEFVGLSSYDSGTESDRDPKLTKMLGASIENKDVLLVEDIVDTGHSFNKLIPLIQEGKPKSLKTCALLSKLARREIEVQVDYVGFTIEDKWVEGYGLDTDEDFRNLPDIWCRK